nr:hypothetical protein [Bacteroidota bacterium]
TLDWAQRYDPAYERAMVFLESSTKTYQSETRNKDMMQKRTLQRARIVALILGFATVISVLFFVWGQDQKMQAEKNNENTQKQKIAAEKNALEANRNRKKAEKAQIEAEIRRIEAEKAILLANRSAEDAIKQQEIALYNQQIAETQSKVAERSRLEAVKQSQNARYQTEIAKQQELIALQKTMEAYNLLLLSVAQSMSVKSTQISEGELKALLAKQAYIFYEQNKGNVNDHYIYDGLYYALKYFEGDEFNVLKAHTDNVRALATTKDGKILYSSGSEGKTFKWDIKEGIPASPQLFGTNPYVNRALAISNDNNMLAIGGEIPIIELYDLAKDGKLKTLKFHNGAIYEIAFGQNGLYSLGGDKVVRYYDYQDNKIVYTGKSKTRTIAANPANESLAIGNDEGEIIIIKNHFTVQHDLLFSDPNIKFHSLTFSNSGRYLAAGDEEGIVRVWDLNDNSLLSTVTGHNSLIRKIKFSNDDSMLASSGFDGKVILWRMANLNDPPNIFNDHQEYVWSLSFTADGNYLIAGCGSGKIKIWPTQSYLLAEKLCGKISRNLSIKEWDQYIGHDIPYEKTCPELVVGKNEK